MAKQNLNTLKSWAVRGWKPMANQVKDWFDSFVHKDDEIPIQKVTGLAQTLNQFTTQQYVDSRLEPDVINGSDVIEYRVPGHLLLRTITVRIPFEAAVRIGTVAYDDDVMPDMTIEANKPTPIALNLEADEAFYIYISGLPEGANIKFYKS